MLKVEGRDFELIRCDGVKFSEGYGEFWLVWNWFESILVGD